MSDGKHPTTTSSPEILQDGSLDPHPAFICTICWQRQPRGSQPKILGTSARIVCGACWRAVLDLSICWVCGECIVRGDEVISLGWCFWHRGCFGCLVCGTKLDVTATVATNVFSEGGKGDVGRKGEWAKWDGSENEVGLIQPARFIGVELEDVPLCSVCEVETAGESTDHVLERGLETVTRFDGGLSRSRMDMLSDASSHRGIGGATRIEESVKSSHCRSKCHKSEPLNPLNGEDMSPLLDNAADMGISEDGSNDDCNFNSDTKMCDFGSARTSLDEWRAAPIVYVSVMDPIGEPAFRPSKTKPLPKWMNLLPNNVRRERGRKAKIAVGATGQSHELEQMRGSLGAYASDGSDDVDVDTLVPGSRAVTPTGNGREEKSSSFKGELTPLQKRATVAFEAMPRGNTVKGFPFKSRSQTLDKDYSAGKECSCSQSGRPQTPYPRSPYPTPRRPSTARDEASSYFSHGSRKASVDEPTSEPSCAPKLQPESTDCSHNLSPTGTLIDKPATTMDLVSPSQSSEYLERYHPKRTPESKYGKYVAGEAEAILEKVKRTKVTNKDNQEDCEEKASDTKGKGKSLNLVDEEFGINPRREDLNKELRTLFCED